MAKQREIEGISAGQPFAIAAAIVVETRAAEVLEHSDGVLDTAEIEAVHDMRVATRRLRAALEVFAPCFPAKQHRAILKEVKAIADALGDRRDRDVAITALERFAESIPRPDRPGISSLIDGFAAEQLDANRRLAAFVEPDRLSALQQALRELTASARSAAAERETG